MVLSLRYILHHTGSRLLLPLLLMLAALHSALPSSAALAADAGLTLPDAIRAAPQEKPVFMAHARGVQIYECRVMRDQPAAYGWVFVAPEADLFDEEGAKLGEHYAGPTWQAADGSRITGMMRGRADAPQAGAIPWLLLTATPASPRQDGEAGRMGHITSVQRVNTMGGAAPRVTCHEGNAGAVARVPYSADYYFLGARQ